MSAARLDLSPVAQAAVAFVRDLGPEEFDTLVGNPLRELGDRGLWWHLLDLEPERLGMIVAEAVADAGHNGVELPLDEHVLAAWTAWEEWARTVTSDSRAVRQLGADTAAGRWDTTARRWSR
jgi:hypothetical protein